MACRLSTLSLVIVAVVAQPVGAAPAGPGPDDWAEKFHQAARRAERQGLIGHAIALRETLVKLKLNDADDARGQELARRSLYRIGANYHHIAWFERAADYYERYARAEPKGADVANALQQAIIFRLGLGQHDRAQGDVALFRSAFAATRERRLLAAAAHFSLELMVRDAEPQRRIAFYRRYLKLWARGGGRSRAVIAHARIGHDLWRTSCPASGVDGLCITMERIRARRRIRMPARCVKWTRKPVDLYPDHQCGRATKARVRLLRRNAPRARLAARHLERALRLAKHVARAEEGAAFERPLAKEFNAALATAHFVLADRSFERYLALPFPGPREYTGSRRRISASRRRLTRFLAAKKKLLHRARWRYINAIKRGAPRWTLAGMARLGQLRQRLADQLYVVPIPAVPIPRALKTAEQRKELVVLFRDTFCDPLEDKAAFFETQARQRFADCLVRATELGLYNRWSRLCEQELRQMLPALYPPSAEIVAQPGYFVLKPRAAGVMTRR